MSEVFAFFKALSLIIDMVILSIKAAKKVAKEGATRKEIKQSIKESHEAFNDNDLDLAGRKLGELLRGSKNKAGLQRSSDDKDSEAKNN